MLVFCVLIVVLAFRGWIGRALARDPDGHTQAAKVQFPIEIEVARDAFWRYDLVPVTVRVVDARGEPRSDTPPSVVVTHKDEVVDTVGAYGESVRLTWDEQQKAWRGNWPPPWNPEPGHYRFRATVAIDPAAWSWEEARIEDEEGEITPAGEAYAEALAAFEIQARPQPKVEPGMCVATWEFDFKSRFKGPDDRTGDWTKLFEWVEYIGADTLWFRAAVTAPPDEGLSLAQPFRPVNLEAVPRLGAEAHRRGLKFGTWATAYATYPHTDEGKNPDYRYSIDISRSTGQTRETNYVSLYDERRVEHLADFFRQMQACEHVDMVGLDYMRTDPGSGGYELVERFTSEMPVKLPEAWESWSERRRQQYVALKVEEEYQSDPKFYECWNWWRAHMGAGIVRRIIEKSGVEKPTWIFVLSWLHGMQHGQDPLMFTDSGVTMLAPMLYQVDDRLHYDEMVKHWNEYVRAGQVNLAVGDQVDFHWHQETRDPPAPAELYDRIVTAHRRYIQDGSTQGAFWHDINRAADPHNLGPYTGREWALAGAAAFSTVRDTWGVLPLRATLTAPDSATIAKAFGVKVKLQNLTNRPVSGVRLSLCDTQHMVGPYLTEAAEGELFGEPFVKVGTVRASEAVEVPLQVRITQPDARLLNETMLALRITWDEGNYEPPVRNDLPRTIVVMKYIRGT